MSLQATIISAHGRRYVGELPDGERLDCFTRSKKSDVACGDQVVVSRIGSGQGVIEGICPRRSLLYRSDTFKQKLIAANVSQVIVVVATEPPFSEEVLCRCLVAAESQQLRTLIVLNKCDLGAAVDAADSKLGLFARLGYPVVRLSAKCDASPLTQFLAGETSVLVGQSGMGKSTLINALVPEADTPTREISTALNSGRHTTTHATLYRLDHDTALIDSPGLQEFGLAHLSREEIELGFREFHDYFGRCRFRNCRHQSEPDCAIRAAIEAGDITARRLEMYHAIVHGLKS